MSMVNQACFKTEAKSKNRRQKDSRNDSMSHTVHITAHHVVTDVIRCLLYESPILHRLVVSCPQYTMLLGPEILQTAAIHSLRRQRRLKENKINMREKTITLSLPSTHFPPAS
jgi:hypothetical protein